MAMFDGHLKCARCRDKGLETKKTKKDCSICKAFTPEQLQLATPTYRDRMNRDKKTVSASPTLILVHPSQVNVLGRVDGEKVLKKLETTPTGKKKHSGESPKPSKKRSSSKPSTEDLKSLGDKWAERFERLEAMILVKSFAVPVELVVKPTEVITSEKPFFDPGAGSSQSTSGLISDVSFTGPSLVQATGEVAVIKATQPVEAPGTRRGDVIQKNATQPVEAPSAWTATQPVEAPGAGPEVLLSDTGSETVQLDQSLTGGNLPDVTGGSESEEDMQSEPGSSTADNFHDRSPDRDDTLEDTA